MASFESWGWKKEAPEEKLEYRRVERGLKRLIKVLRSDVDKLQQHKQTIAKLETLGEYDALNKQHVNARSTIQHLKSNIRQLENNRSQVRDEDLEKFDSQVRDLQLDAITAVNDFISSTSSASSPLREMSSNRIGPDHPKSFGGNDEGDEEETPQRDGLQVQNQLVAPLMVNQSLQSQESWNQLQEDLEDLNSIMHEFASLVEGQQEQIDDIEKNVETAAENVHEGTKSIVRAHGWKAAAFPLAGALVGGLVGGPIGLAAGLKLGGLAAVGGGIAGYTGGTIMKKHQEKEIGTELENLTAPRSKSLPENLARAADNTSPAANNTSSAAVNMPRAGAGNMPRAGAGNTPCTADNTSSAANNTSSAAVNTPRAGAGNTPCAADNTSSAANNTYQTGADKTLCAADNTPRAADNTCSAADNTSHAGAAEKEPAQRTDGPTRGLSQGKDGTAVTGAANDDTKGEDNHLDIIQVENS